VSKNHDSTFEHAVAVRHTRSSLGDEFMEVNSRYPRVFKLIAPVPLSTRRAQPDPDSFVF
jgi:hypothetical protein